MKVKTYEGSIIFQVHFIHRIYFSTLLANLKQTTYLKNRNDTGDKSVPYNRKLIVCTTDYLFAIPPEIKLSTAKLILPWFRLLTWLLHNTSWACCFCATNRIFGYGNRQKKSCLFQCPVQQIRFLLIFPKVFVLYPYHCYSNMSWPSTIHITYIK